MARNAEDYGIPDLSDTQLQILAADVRKYGEKGKFAQKELAKRQGMLQQADLYTKALQKATYAQLGPEFSGGLNQITNYLAGAGPLADSGARTALSRQLYSQILQRAQGQIGMGASDIIGNLIKQRQQYRYQSQLLQQQQQGQKKKWYDYAIPAAAAIGGAALGGPAGAGAAYGATGGY